MLNYSCSIPFQGERLSRVKEYYRTTILKKFLAFIVPSLITLFPVCGFAQPSSDELPASGVKSPYSPLSVPTTLKPLEDSLAALLNKNYRITTSAPYSGAGEVFTLIHHNQNVLCVLTPPNPQTDQNIPTSRCWMLN